MVFFLRPSATRIRWILDEYIWPRFTIDHQWVVPTLKRDTKYFKNGREWLKFLYTQSTNVTNKLTAKQALFLQIYCNYKNDMHKDQNPVLASTKDSQLVTYLEWSYSKRRELTQRWLDQDQTHLHVILSTFQWLQLLNLNFPPKLFSPLVQKPSFPKCQFTAENINFWQTLYGTFQTSLEFDFKNAFIVNWNFAHHNVGHKIPKIKF